MPLRKPILPSQLPTISQLYASSTIHPTATNPFPLLTVPHPIRTSAYNNVLSLVKKDITLLSTTAILNAANSSLLGGGGVDGAIHRAAGPGLVKDCRKLDGCDTGDAKLTAGHELPARYVVHAVGPVYGRERDGEGSEERLLAGCYTKALDLVAGLRDDGPEDEAGRSIALSCLSTGVYGYPKEDAARVAIAAVLDWLVEKKGGGMAKVCFVCFEERDYEAYLDLLPQYCPPEEEKKGKDVEAAPDTESQDGKVLDLPDAPTAEPKAGGEPDAKKTKTTHGQE